jgi:hypothetical protein
MESSLSRSLLCFWLTLVACGDNNRPPTVSETCDVGPEAYAKNPDAYKTVSLWVQDDPEVPPSVALEGCELWQSKCVKCERVATANDAAARIFVSHETCVLDISRGGFILGIARKNGEITVYLDCIALVFGLGDDGHVNREKLKLVIGHEIGHEAGMPYHVPATCETASAASEFEKGLVRQGVCGKALMNPHIDNDIAGITAIDAEAYDLRDPYISTFPRIAVTDTPDGCILTSPAR